MLKCQDLDLPTFEESHFKSRMTELFCIYLTTRFFYDNPNKECQRVKIIYMRVKYGKSYNQILISVTFEGPILRIKTVSVEYY